MTSHNTRPSLLVRVRDSEDEEAWREFDVRYRDLILRYCRSRGLQQWDAEDVRQGVMLGLSRSLRSFRYDRGAGRFRNYLGRVVQNAINRHQSSPKGQPVVLDTDGMEAVLPDLSEEAGELWEREWQNHHLRLGMKTIRATTNPRHVEVFDHLLEGKSVAQVAGVTGMSEQAIHKVKQRVRARLRELIAGQVRDEDGSTG